MNITANFKNTLYQFKKDKSVFFDKHIDYYNDLLEFALSELIEVQKKHKGKKFILLDKKQGNFEVYLQLFEDNQTLSLVYHNYRDNVKEKFFFYFHNNRVFIKYIIFKASNPPFIVKDETIFDSNEYDILNVEVADDNILNDISTVFHEMSIEIEKPYEYA